MEIIIEPHVEVVAKTKFEGHSRYDIPPGGDDALRTCAFAAKGCYDSYGVDGNPVRNNQDTIVSSGHGSVLEHYYVSLFIEGVSRGLSLELNRHRHFAISQRSTRYTEEDDAAIVLDPYYANLYQWDPSLRTHREERILRDHIESCKLSIEYYIAQVDDLIKQNPLNLEGVALRKWARGKARNVLPHCLETRGTWTANIRAWRHILETRSSRHAESEIRRLMQHIFRALNHVIPFYLSDYNINNVNDLPEYTTDHEKV